MLYCTERRWHSTPDAAAHRLARPHPRHLCPLCATDNNIRKPRSSTSVVDLRWRAERAVIAAKDAHTMITFLCVSSFCGCRTEAHGLSQARLQDLYAASSIRHTPTCCTSRPRHCPLASLTVYFRALVSYPQMCTATRNARCWRCHMRSTSCFCVLVCCNALEHTCWLHDAERGQVQHLRPSQKGPQACCHDLQP